MRAIAVIAVFGLLAPLAGAADKLTEKERIELLRGLSSEYANAKVLLPRSKKSLEFDAQAGTFDKKAWLEIAKESGPAARTGDLVQVTKIDIAEDHIVLQINGGFNGGRKWYQGVQVSGGPGVTPVPIANSDTNAPGGTSIVVLFHKSLAGTNSADIKKLLAPVLDFDRHSATQLFTETLPPETQAAIKEKRAVVGMDKEQVRLALGQPTRHERDPHPDGDDTEEWIYGMPPGKITFVTFTNEKVTKVKVDYAGLGTDVGPVKQ